jgi:WD40 repeat protein
MSSRVNEKPSSEKIPKIPNELLYNIVEQATDAPSLANIARTSKTLNTIVRYHGWRSYVKRHFPGKVLNLPFDIDYAQVARGLTGFERAWERRAIHMGLVFHNYSFRYSNGSRFLRDSGWKQGVQHISCPRSTQTIAHRPVVDSLEEIRASVWSSRQEYLALSQGAALCLRSKVYERYPGEIWSGKVRDNLSNMYYRPPWLEDGPDDIVSLHIIDAANEDATGMRMKVLLGRASGELSLMEFSIAAGKMDKKQAVLIASFHFNGGQPRTHVSPSKNRFVTWGVNGMVQIFFDLPSKQFDSNGNEDLNNHQPLDPALSEHFHEYLRTAHFLSDNTLLLGKHKSSQPISLFTIRPTGLTPVSTANVIFNSDPPVSTTVLCRLPTNQSSHTNLFLSGNSDGTTRLHDIRSSRSFEALLGDPLDDGTPWSIATKGMNQVYVALGDCGIVQSFDLRASLATPLPLHFQKRCDTGSLKAMAEDEYRAYTRPAKGWSLFVDRAKSVHCLSSPSDFSPTLYVASEGRVEQWECANHKDKFIDTAYNINQPEKQDIWRWARDQRHSLKHTSVFPVSRFEHKSPNIVSDGKF